MPKMRLAPEGWVFLIPFVLLLALALLLQSYALALLFFVIVAFMVNFFRDPHRAGSERHIDILSPADGTVVQIKAIADGETWPGLTRQVSIFMSVLDVHVNRAPMTGQIVHYRYNAGKKIAAFAEKSSTENEKNLIVVTDDR